MKKIISALLIFTIVITAKAQCFLPNIDSLTIDEKIGQLIMIDVYSNKNQAENERYLQLIKKYHLGGVIFFQGTPHKQLELVKKFQTESKIPLLIGLDAEHGAGWRLKGAMTFPQMQTLGAISEDSITQQIAKAISRHCRATGVNMNFAPVADVNNNPKNPIINTRSFGEIPESVAKNTIEYIEGSIEEGVIPVAKHFPGHGDTESDSHITLPTVNKSIKELDSIELYPFKRAINAGCPAIMTGHLHIPTMDSTTPSASLSQRIVTEWLRDSLYFDGIKVTDALNMKGARGDMPLGETEVQALIAGNDILLFPENIDKAFAAIKKAIKDGRITEKELDSHVKKIIALKQVLFGEEGFNPTYLPCDSTALYQTICTPQDSMLRELAYSKALTLIKNEKELLPLKRIDTLNIAVVHFNSNGNNEFQKYIEKYSKATAITAAGNTVASLYSKLKPYNCVIIFNGDATNRASTRYGYSTILAQLIERIGAEKRVILYHPATPYGVAEYVEKPCNSVLIGYEKCPEAEKAAAQAIFGGIELNGKLPVSVSDKFPAGHGITTPKIRLGYSRPEYKGIDSHKFKPIDSICNNAIKIKATPGCQVLIVKDGYIIFNQCYGNHKYKNGRKNSNNNLYDVASVTKVVATLPAIMQLYQNRTIELNDKIAEYTPQLIDSVKSDIDIFSLLAHESQLPSGISFIGKAINMKSVNDKLYSSRYSSTFSKKVKAGLYMNPRYKFNPKTLSKTAREGYVKRSGNLYMHPTFLDTCYTWIHNVPLNKKSGYVYSDLNFILLGKLVEKVCNTTLNNYCQENIYHKIGAFHTGYSPLELSSRENIVPSSIDNIYGRGEIHGTVHDPSAAILGGNCGHAGIFTTAEDLAKIMQMYLQMGSYGGEQIIDSCVVAQFTQRNGMNRRGLGFDKPSEKPDQPSPAAVEASAESYGHLGFTGTMVWNDPNYNLTYIFLSNKSYPDEYNSKLVDENIRTNIQSIIYQSIAPISCLNN